jgi:saposin
VSIIDLLIYRFSFSSFRRNAKGCGAVKHCIKTVWEKHQVPVDTDSICKICLDMVGQARDQLESNETQADLKAVFEGSCNLIPIKPVRHECVKLADDFVPELVETLASEMNPQQVCSVAGLCNNANIDKLLEAYAKTQPPAVVVEKPVTDGFTCEKCNSIATTISNKFRSTDRDTVLENILRGCGQLSTFSDACSNYVLTYFTDIYEHVEKNLNAEGICHLSGSCSARFHQHPELVEVRPMGKVGEVAVGKDDIPCELCEQLVQHLRDVLIANTTELEFKQVLEGFCKQTKGFTKECMSIVDQYYDVIYKNLVNNLDPNGMCFMIGICQKGDGYKTGPIMPLVKPSEVKITSLQSGPIPMHKKLLGQNEPKFTAEEIQSFALPPSRHFGFTEGGVDDTQLPIDQLIGAPLSLNLVKNGEWCSICQYFMHFVQEAMSLPKNEVKKIYYSKNCDVSKNYFLHSQAYTLESVKNTRTEFAYYFMLYVCQHSCFEQHFLTNLTRRRQSKMAAKLEIQ